MFHAPHLSLTTSLGCLAWISGVFVASLWLQAGAWILVLLSIISILWRVPQWTMWFIVFFCLIGGYSWTLLSLDSRENEKNTLGEKIGWEGFSHHIVGETVTLLGVSEYNRRYKVQIQSIDDQETDFLVALIVPPNITLSPGDTFKAFGKFRFPRDTSEYAAEKNLWYRGMIAEFQSFQSTKQPPEKYSFLVRLRNSLDQQLKNIFPPSGYSLLSGILLGQRAMMDTTLKEQLKASGLMHLMVVSGGNIMMLIIFISLFIRSLSVWIRIGIIMITVFGFTLLVGGDMPVWRAALMGTIGYIGSLWGHRFPSLILPLMVAVALSIYSPLSLVYDIGLQLSFLSVICIIVWGKKLAHMMRFLGNFFGEATALTIAATIGTLPITLFYFGTFSGVGPLANMLAAPAIPIIMYSGIVSLFASLFSPQLALWLGYIPWIGTTYLSTLITFFGSQKWSLISLDITEYRHLFMVLSIGILFLLILREKVGLRKESVKDF